MDNPYLRKGLRATSTGAADPMVEIEQWLDRLGYAVEGGLDDEPAEQAFELLSTWAALQRVRPELLERAEGQDVLSQAQQRLMLEAAEHTRLALSLLNTERWLEQAERFTHAMTEAELTKADEETAWAADLIQDLDEASLLLYAAGHWAPDEPVDKLAGQLRACEDWLEKHADYFGAASVVIQATALTLRPDLEQQDSVLARTATKFVRLLDAMEAMEAELTLEGIEPFTPEELAALPEVRTSDVAAHEGPYWLPQPRETPLAAAAGAATPRVHWHGRWREPAGNRTARLVLLAEPAPDHDELVELTFHTAQGAPATELTGTSVTLAGVTATIKQSVARFRLGDLLVAAAEPELWVHAKRWELQPDE